MSSPVLPFGSVGLAAAILASVLGAQVRLEPEQRGHLELREPRAAEPVGVNAFLVGDADGDGDRDVIVVDKWSFSLLRNDGTGVLRRTTASGSAGSLRTAVLVDADGDRDLDVVTVPGNTTGYGGPGAASAWVNDGTGAYRAFGHGVTLPVLQFQGIDGFATDVDGDGDQDLLLVTDGFGTRPVLCWTNAGGGFTDATAQSIPAAPIRPDRAYLADVNGDRFDDLLVYGNGSALLLVNDRTGRFVDRTAWLPNDAIVAAADLDGDGDVDLLGRGHVHANDGTGTAYVSTLHGATLTGTTFGLGDFDGDRRPDVFACNHLRAPSLYLQTSPGRFTDLTPSWIEPRVRNHPQAAAWLSTSVSRLAVADFDRDGDPDALIGGSEGRYSSFTTGIPPKVLVNAGGQRLVDGSRERFEAGCRSTTSVAAGDVDGDGDVDAVVGDNGILLPVTSWVFRNDGAGRFEPAPGGTWQGGASASLRLVDLDADGDLDLVEGNGVERYQWALPYPRQNRLGRNDGTGRFTDVTATHFPSVQFGTADAEAGDVDGDGDVDLVFANADGTTGAVRLWRNDGTARFRADSVPMPLPAIAAWSVELRDFDRDGDLDLFVLATQGAWFLANRGDGSFADESVARLGPNRPGGHDVPLAAGDVDGDGDLDAVAPIGTWLNDGRGTFTFGSVRACGGSAGLLADFDEDGRVDAIWGTGGGSVCRDDQPIWLAGSYCGIEALGAADVDGDDDLDLLAHARATIGNLARENTAPAMSVLVNFRRQLRAPVHPRLGQPYRLELHGTDRSGASSGLLVVGVPGTRTRIDVLGAFGLAPWPLVAIPQVLNVAAPQGGTLTVAVPADAALAGVLLGAQGLVWHANDLRSARFTNVVADEVLR
jgi:hypothetical protein